MLVGVFDGHGNDMCAEFCKQNFAAIMKQEIGKNIGTQTALRNTLRLLDQKWEHG